MLPRPRTGVNNTFPPQTTEVLIGQPERPNVTEVIVDAVADAEGVSPLELEPPLYAAVDPDALEQFVASVRGPNAGEVEVSFEYAGHDVTVTGAGDVRVGAESP